jgi:hypothetical protein
VRNCRPAQQRVWLGPHRYSGSCRQPTPTPNAYSYANSDRYTFGMRRYGNAYSNGDGYCYSDGNIHGYSNAHGYGDRHSNRYSYSNAPTHVYAEICADTEASSHTAA